MYENFPIIESTTDEFVETSFENIVQIFSGEFECVRPGYYSQLLHRDRCKNFEEGFLVESRLT